MQTHTDKRIHILLQTAKPTNSLLLPFVSNSETAAAALPHHKKEKQRRIHRRNMLCSSLTLSSFFCYSTVLQHSHAQQNRVAHATHTRTALFAPLCSTGIQKGEKSRRRKIATKNCSEMNGSTNKRFGDFANKKSDRAQSAKITITPSQRQRCITKNKNNKQNSL